MLILTAKNDGQIVERISALVSVGDAVFSLIRLLLSLFAPNVMKNKVLFFLNLKHPRKENDMIQ